MLNRSLKQEDTPLNAMIARSHPGMATWAGGGPDGCVCWGCGDFNRPTKDTKKGSCNRFKRMTGRGPYQKIDPKTGKEKLVTPASPTFPARTPACRYFEARK